MTTFVAILFGDRKGYDRTPIDVRNAAHAHDDKMQKEGAVIGIAQSPTQVRNPEAKGVEKMSGPFMHSSLPVAGFNVFDADNLEEAIRLASQVPCAVSHGVVEVWPLKLLGSK